MHTIADQLLIRNIIIFVLLLLHFFLSITIFLLGKIKSMNMNFVEF